MKRFLISATICLGVLAMAGMFAFAWMGYSFNRALKPKTDPRLYGQVIRARAKASPRYGFFPATIDSQAVQTGFFHVPGFLQGSDIVSLRVRLPEEKVAQIKSELEASGRTEIHDFGDISKLRCYPAFGRTKTSRKSNCKNRAAGMSVLPGDFRVFLFQTDLRGVKKHGNHNFMGFTAVSVERNEVLYFAENW